MPRKPSRMSEPADETFRWLHISDLHLGQPGERLWLQAQEEFWSDLQQTLRSVGGPLHLVLLTGDLAYSGEASEYTDKVNPFLDELRARIAAACEGARPPVVPVPGNHDVAWPTGEEWRYAMLGRYETPEVASLRKTLWEQRDPSPIAPLFGAYEQWRGTHIDPELDADPDIEYQPSFFPGDFRLRFEVSNRLKVGIVGLNSAWVQYTGSERDDEFKGALVLAPQQYQAAMSGDDGRLINVADWCNQALLLMHHPVDWLSPTARVEFESHVYPTGPAARFAACLFGHEHAGRSIASSEFGAAARCYLEVPSLFGVEGLGKSAETRSFGYGLGSLQENGELRIWPRRRVLRGHNSYAFAADGRYELDARRSFVLRPKDTSGNISTTKSGGHPPTASPRQSPTRSPGPAPRVESDLRLFARTEITEVELIGVGAGGPSFPLDEIYVPLGLSARPPRWLGGDVESGEPRHIAEAMGLQGQEITPEKAFAVAGRDHHLVLFGEPGSGKTTALRKLAHVVLTAGGQALGLPPDTIPLLLRLRQLRRGHLRHSLDTFIRRELHALSGPRFPRRLARQLWTRGRLLLLLDGLDEIADEALRAEVCAYLDQQLAGQHERGIRAAVSCRYAGYGGAVRLGSRFLHLDIRPLDDGQIAGLIHAWFRAARRALELDPARRDEAVRRARSEAADLVARLGRKEFASQRIKELVSTPLLLVLLCVQVMRGHVIPRRRVDFYARCLDVLLETKLRERAEDRLLERADTLDLLLSLAWRLHTARRRDDLTSEEFAAVASPVLERVRRGSGESPAPEALLDQLRRGAGVVTRYAQDRYGFMHLGLQEYLAAVHAARERSGALLVEMAQQVGEEWWREPILLAVGLSEYQAFVPLMEAVLARGDLAGHLDLVRECLDEAHAPDPAPFAAVVADDGAAPGHRAAVLRLYQDRGEPAIAEAVASAGLMEHEDLDLRALARQVCGKAGMEVPPETHADVAGDVAAAVPGPRTSERAVELLPGMRALWVPGGTFTLGGDPDALNARPAAEVAVPGFWLGEAPVTNDQYRVFLEETGHDEPPYWRKRRFNDPRQPVVTASWHDAVAFCAWLTQRQQTARTVELPTEVQWERAARGSDGRIYPWGAQSPDETRACFDLAWGEDRPAPVGSFPAGRGPYGHLDLAGLVWEWTRDDVSGEFGGRALRALRGGSWNCPAQFLRSASRFWYPAEVRYDVIGFRVSCGPASTGSP